MSQAFGEKITPTAAIHAILESYPFSIGLLRELLQNSDDAGATKQTFVLDRRTHNSAFIYHPYLVETQGPALLAYNSESIREEDWKALQNIHRSSKTADITKIGKYGIGFRSCYHVTNTPHILSGSYLAILDPQHDFTEDGGVKLDIVENREQYRDHLSSFGALIPFSETGQPFNGSIFRLPLRRYPSEIGNRSIAPDEISLLLKNFALEELNIVLLFLHNVTSIEIYEIGVDGEKTEIASATIDRSPIESHGQFHIWKSIIRTNLPDSLEEREWRILHAPFSETEAIQALSKRFGGDPATTLSQHKLIPTVDLAIPLNSPGMTNIGRLFTFLPLPLITEFPVHVNALFSLTQSRQNLRNGGEVGIVKNSDDHALIEWNQLLFDTYIPQAWAALLEVLAQRDQVAKIFDAWPIPQADVQSGDYFYWKGMAPSVTKYAIDLPVWPLYGQSSLAYGRVDELLMAESSTASDVLTVLVRTGLVITRPPQYVVEIIVDTLADNIRILSPKIVHTELFNLTRELYNLDNEDIVIILEYLLSTSDCKCIIGLPLVPSASGNRVALDAKDPPRSSPPRILLNNLEEGLFGAYDSNALSLQRLASNVRDVILTHGLGVLNIDLLNSSHVVEYLKACPYAAERHGGLGSDQVDWLNRFWSFAQESSWNLDCFDQFFLVPTTQGSQRQTDTVFITQAEPDIPTLLEILGIAILDPRMEIHAQGALKNVFPSSNIHALLHALPENIVANFTKDQATKLSSYFIRHLPSRLASTDAPLRSLLRSIPMYPLLSSSSDQDLLPTISSIPNQFRVRGVDPNLVPILPEVSSTTWVDLRYIEQGILQYLDPRHPAPISVGGMQELMLDHFQSQSPTAQLKFVQHLAANHSSVTRQSLKRLASIEFVPASDGSHRAPEELVDPEAPIASLFTELSPSLPDISRPARKTLVRGLRSLKILRSDLSLDMVRERAKFIFAHQNCELAKKVIHFISRTDFDCRHLFDSSFTRDLEWIPTPIGLKSPLLCRDPSSHGGRTQLFDEVMPMILPDVQISHYLREAFLWNAGVPFELLTQQLVKVLDSSAQSFRKILDIIEHLGNRSFSSAELSSLHLLLGNRKWVPTRTETLVETRFVLLGGEDIPSVGFYQTYFDSRMHNFLRKMGCTDRPSKETILNQLQHLYTSFIAKMANESVIAGVIRLLSWLPQLNPAERANLIIPDTKGMLRPFDAIRYNDLDTRACLVDIGNNFLAHPHISEGVAQKLGLYRLGLMSSGGHPEDDLDMGEDLVTTIRNRLREYTDSQLLLEFVANASDAGATEFDILLDEKVAPAEGLISTHCRDFQHVPSLLIHNNSTFTNDDFVGILRTGIGGKAGKMNTIGQFGLGALTMFHVTELAMIVSGDQVLFLNPCKVHLSIDRVALRRPLSVVRRLYPGHLDPLIGLFGFNLPEDSAEAYNYNGTLFRLPLRSSTQFYTRVKPIFTKVISLDNLASTFKEVASKCLLFTRINSIRCFERKGGAPILRWSTLASRTGISNITDHISSHTISISEFPDQGCHDWQILSLAVDESFLEDDLQTLREKYRLRMSPLIQIAAACSTPDPNHYLFSTLPLPILLDLPVHVSGPFILASDRRSIRLDEYENIEASYNRWLLANVIPMLWLHLLADRAAFSNNSSFWPGNEKASSNKYNIISTLTIDAVYQEAISSDLPIFSSKYSSEALSLRGAHFIYHTPDSVVRVLEAIKPPDAVELPPAVTRRLKNSTKDSLLSVVSPIYLHDQIMLRSSQFSATVLEDGELQELIRFLLKGPNPFGCLDGLPILPIEDGTFARFNGSSSQPNFFIDPREAEDKGIFHPSRIVRRTLPSTELVKISELNVKAITDDNIQLLISDYLPEAALLEEAGPRTRTWIEDFWKAFPFLDVSISATSSFPLIPTLTPGTYLSLSHSRTTTTIITNFRGATGLAECLTQMGFKLIDTAYLSEEARSTLSSNELSVEYILPKLFEHSENPTTLLDSLTLESRLTFLSWIRSGLRMKNKRFFEQHPEYRRLPLWVSVDGSDVSANEVQMLPPRVSLKSVGPFAAPGVVACDPLLELMGKEPPSSIQSVLKFPTRLDRHLDGAYLILVPILLAYTPEGTAIPVPNSKRDIQLSDTLYSYEDALFLAAFGTGSGRFLLPAFRRFERLLESFGLRRQRNLSIELFRSCVDTFQRNIRSAHDAEDRAAVLFHIFAEDLPLHDNIAQDNEWPTLDNLRFVPRNTSPLHFADIEAKLFIAPHIRALPAIVSPNKLVREEYLAIAWSQRALYKVEPRRILMVYQELSIPKAEEVVNHLAVLATDVASMHHHNPTLIQHLTQTYEWLIEHTEPAQSFLQEFNTNDIPLFLNVDDPADESEDWNWRAASSILIDTYDTGFLQFPRNFLKPFSLLLIAAGARTIDYGDGEEIEANLEPRNDEESLFNLRTTFNEMRKDGICVDVCFTSPQFGDNGPIYAHRAFLAACNGHFRQMFSGSFREAAPASSEHPINVCVLEHSYDCVKRVIDFLYTAQEPTFTQIETDTDLALDMLSLTQSWSMTGLHHALQWLIIRLRMVNPFNVDNVLSAAKRAEAMDLVDYCERYIERNFELVEEAREHGRADSSSPE